METKIINFILKVQVAFMATVLLFIHVGAYGQQIIPRLATPEKGTHLIGDQSVSVNIPDPLVFFDLTWDNSIGQSQAEIQTEGEPLIIKGNGVTPPSNPATFQNRLNDNDVLRLDRPASNRAVTWAGNSISRAYLFGLKQKNAPNFQESTEFTVAGWFYKDENKNNGMRKSILFGDDRFGIFSRGDSLFMTRFIDINTGAYAAQFEQANGTPYAFYNWSPTALDKGSGWYFIGMTQTEWVTRIFVGKGRAQGFTPNTDPIEEFSCNMFILGKQPFVSDGSGSSHILNIVEWGFGSYSTNVSYIDGVDDFAVWGEALTPFQMQAMYECSKNKMPNETGSPCWGTGIANGRVVKVEEEAPSDELTEKIPLIMYPNPLERGQSLTLRFQLETSSDVLLTIHDLSGRLVTKESFDQMGVGIHELEVNSLLGACQCSASSSGVYMVNLRSAEFNETRRVIVK